MFRCLLLSLMWIVLLPGARGQGEEPVSLTLDGDFTLELTATWEPLTDTVYKFEREHELCQNWSPVRKRQSYDAEVFRAFLPEGPVAVGDLWQLDVNDAVMLLRQLHPGATDFLHHGLGSGVAAPGAWALLRAAGPDQAELLMRVHVDFLLDGDGDRRNSSWLTPAQFEGRMVLDRARGVVTSFVLALPDQSANVDLNIATDLGVSADIGRIPRMELRGGEELPATRPAPGTAIPLDEARLALEQKFYPISEVEWLELEDALAHSRESRKPMHVIALFGSLTDESC